MKKRGTQLTARAGEHLVVSELNKRGYFSTPFAGAVPEFDVIAVDENFRTIPIQVKTAREKSFWWLGDARNWMQIDDSKEGEQKILSLKEIEHSDLIYMFVNLEPVEFYMMRKRELQQLLYDGYKYYIEKLGGKRKSFSLAIHAKSLKGFKEFKDNWKIFEEV
jgi:hypothetical protein